MIHELIIGNRMMRRYLREILIDLGELEGDYRAFHLRDDIAQALLSLTIALMSILSMLRVDFNLFAEEPAVLARVAGLRLGFVVVTLAMMYLIRRSQKVRIFDRLVFSWILLMILFFIVSSFVRPAGIVATASGIIVPFSIYVLSPLRIRRTIALALTFTLAMLLADVSAGALIPSLYGGVIAGQLIVHVLGLGSALQIQSYRRKSFKAYVQEKDAKEMAAYLANIDPLTKSMTRRQFFSIAQAEFLRYSRYHRPLSLLILDVDHFKRVNDTYGHHAGDVVLRSLSLVILEQKRAPDTYGRLGGEEFGLLLPETSLEQARVVAERIQQFCEQTPTRMDGELIHSTVSIGGAQAAEGDKSVDDVLRRADRMLFKAKERGKNQVVLE